MTLKSVENPGDGDAEDYMLSECPNRTANNKYLAVSWPTTREDWETLSKPTTVRQYFR